MIQDLLSATLAARKSCYRGRAVPRSLYSLLALVGVTGCARASTDVVESPATASTLPSRDVEPVGALPADSDDADRSAEPARPAARATNVGIVECDEYLTKYWLCVEEKMPEEALATVREALDVTAEAWREVAAGPERDDLAGVCLRAIESAKVATEPFGCVW
jgi:hypothetical protein